MLGKVPLDGIGYSGVDTMLALSLMLFLASNAQAFQQWHDHETLLRAFLAHVRSTRKATRTDTYSTLTLGGQIVPTHRLGRIRRDGGNTVKHQTKLAAVLRSKEPDSKGAQAAQPPDEPPSESPEDMSWRVVLQSHRKPQERHSQQQQQHDNDKVGEEEEQAQE